MLLYRIAATTAALAGPLLIGCGAPDEPTDLRTSGPLDVTTVTVMTDLVSASDPDVAGLPRLMETATHCRLGDVKRPGIVGMPDFTTTQVCPSDIDAPAGAEGTAEGAPSSWYVRIVFDQLLDPDVEELVTLPSGTTIGTLARTQPVTLTCNGTPVAYDGYYVPNGNRISWPLGPALYIAPVDPLTAAVAASCEVTIKNTVHSKKGSVVPDDQRTWTFQIAPLAFRFALPAADASPDGSFVMDPGTPIVMFWTAALWADAQDHTLRTLDPADVVITKGPSLQVTPTTDGDPDPHVCDGTSGTAVPAAEISAATADTDPDHPGPDTLALMMNLGTTTSPDYVWEPQTTYRVTFAPTARVSAKQGGPDGTFPADYDFCFHTAAPAPM